MVKLSILNSHRRNASVQVLNDDAFPEQGQACVVLCFSDGSRLRASYWRLIVKGRAELSSFDHEQKYGLPEPIDAKESLRRALDGRICLEVRLDTETGDLLLAFDADARLQVFNFTGYEIWDFSFPDGTREFSNYALKR